MSDVSMGENLVYETPDSSKISKVETLAKLNSSLGDPIFAVDLNTKNN
jgi:hypothetical protein